MDITDNDLVRIGLEGPGGERVAIAIFGSFATGRARPDSDVDLTCFVESLPEKAADRYRIEFHGERMVCVLLSTLDEIDGRLSAPESAVWTVPALRNARALLDRVGAFARLQEKARAFDWQPMQGAANAYASQRMMKFAEEALKLTSALRRGSNEAILTETIWLILGLPMVVAVQRGLFLENETRMPAQVHEALGVDSRWSCRYLEAAGLADGATASTVRSRGMAALRLYAETAKLLRPIVLPRHWELVAKVLSVSSEHAVD